MEAGAGKCDEMGRICDGQGFAIILQFDCVFSEKRDRLVQKNCNMRTERRNALKKMLAGLAGMVGLSLGVKGGMGARGVLGEEGIGGKLMAGGAGMGDVEKEGGGVAGRAKGGDGVGAAGEKEVFNVVQDQDVPLFAGSTKFNGMVFIAGKGAHFEGDIKSHTDHVLKELEKELQAAGSSMEKVLKVSVFLNDIADYQGMNEVYKGRFGNKPPVRTTVAVGRQRCRVFAGVGRDSGPGEEGDSEEGSFQGAGHSYLH